MKLALIPPHNRITDTSHTNYQLMLAHIVATPGMDGIQYCREYLDRQERGDYIILDNGAYEGSLVTAKVLTDLANDFIPNEIVIPDSYKNASITEAMATSYFNEYRPWLNPDVALMYVAQGTTVYEVEDSIQWAMRQDWIKTIALPKHLLQTCEYKEARIHFAKLIRAKSNKDIHFLGASPLWTDEIRAARDSGIVRGMDTSMPYVYGYNYETWPSEAVIDSSESRSFYFDLVGDRAQDEIITLNVKGMIDCVNEL